VLAHRLSGGGGQLVASSDGNEKGRWRTCPVSHYGDGIGRGETRGKKSWGRRSREKGRERCRPAFKVHPMNAPVGKRGNLAHHLTDQAMTRPGVLNVNKKPQNKPLCRQTASSVLQTLCYRFGGGCTASATAYEARIAGLSRASPL